MKAVIFVTLTHTGAGILLTHSNNTPLLFTRQHALCLLAFPVAFKGQRWIFFPQNGMQSYISKMK